MEQEEIVQLSAPWSVSRTDWVSWYRNVKTLWILLQHEIMEVILLTTGTVQSFSQITAVNIPVLSFYRLDALPVSLPTCKALKDKQQEINKFKDHVQ